jgi:2-polyprenyl-6-methoxyphenol hydroxylase-like FAD-dependent oxidoreductase
MQDSPRTRRKIAIVGSGHAGLIAGHALLQAGHAITLYSDRTAEQWLHGSRPTGAAARFASALSYERKLGLAHWEHLAPKAYGAQLTLCPSADNRLVTMTGRSETYFQAVDLRLQSHRWLRDLEAAGAQVVIGKVDVAGLDAIAARSDLVLVATGRGPLAELFPRNVERSVYDAPQRKLTMVIVTGATQEIDGVPFLGARFDMLAPYGEMVAVPYYHRDHGATWCVSFEAKPGGAMDRFDGCTTGEQAVAVAKQVIRDLLPWQAAWAEHMELADPEGWLMGGVAPTVREPVGRLPSGRVVMPLGDTAISLDPIAGQGANLGNKLVQHIVATLAAAPGAALDAGWMTRTFETFWADHGAASVAYTNLLLEPATAATRLLLIAQCGSTGSGNAPHQRIANAMYENFVDPRRMTAAFLDRAEAHKVISELSGHSWLRQLIRGAARVAASQVRRMFGAGPAHVQLLPHTS